MRSLKRNLLAGALIVVTGGSAATDAGAAPAPTSVPLATAKLHDAKDEQVGVLAITRAGDDALRISVDVWGLREGFHGFHIHKKGRCRPKSFKSAGGHIGPKGVPHPRHAGDLPNLQAMGDGAAIMETVTDRIGPRDLFDKDGSAVIVHAKADNHGNIPKHYGRTDPKTAKTGDAGDRIACGVIKK